MFTKMNLEALMNYYEHLILKTILSDGYKSQRQLASETRLSLGLVNKTLNKLIAEGILTKDMKVRPSDADEVRCFTPERAVILAAGYGLRMVPIGSEVPKALLEVRGEVLIERQIRQLQEKGIEEIYVVVGYLKEMFEYLIDEFHVHLLYNKDYDKKNNLFSLGLAKDKIRNAYIIPGDVYTITNPFSQKETYSWYMLGEEEEEGSGFRVSRSGTVKRVPLDQKGNRVLGISYLTEEKGRLLADCMEDLMKEDDWAHSFWEEALFQKKMGGIFPKFVRKEEAVEITTYMDLKSLDAESDHLNSKVLKYIAEVFHVSLDEIQEISLMKKGMTNRSFLFELRGERYIMRLPGEGTEHLINRTGEYHTYEAIKGEGISDQVVAICPEKGYKITKYWQDTRECDPQNPQEVSACMAYLRAFHEKKLTVPHSFNLFESIDYYESLWTRETLFGDYEKVKEKVTALKPFIEKESGDFVLTHIDAVPDNFLFTEEGIRLIDWEYAGMQDPHVDLAMFAIYALYDEKEFDHLMEAYFKTKPDRKTRMKLYAYVSVCGLLWSNWCEYKRMLGVEFGEYSLRQYRYAKEYSKIVLDYMEKDWENE